jgi:hypothetical protein
VDENKITERERLSGRQSVGAIGGLVAREAAQGEGIGGAQGVAARVPPCWVAQIRGMIQDGYARGSGGKVRLVVDPSSGLAPHLGGAFAAF